MGSPLSVAHLKHAPTKRWLDDDILRWAAHDGTAESLSQEDLQAWYVADRRVFRPFGGTHEAQQRAMYTRVRTYLAARLAEQVPDGTEGYSRDLLLAGVTELTGFETVVRIPNSRGAQGPSATAFMQAAENGVLQWIVGTQDVWALIAVLRVSKGNRLHELAAVRLRELADPKTVAILLAAIGDSTALMQQQLLQILGSTRAVVAYEIIDRYREAYGEGHMVAQAAAEALLQIALVHPAQMLEQVIGAATQPDDPVLATRAVSRLQWLCKALFHTRGLESTQREQLAVLFTDRIAAAIESTADARTRTLQLMLVRVLGDIPGHAATQRLHGYFEDRHAEVPLNIVVQALTQNYAQWDALELDRSVLEAARQRTRTEFAWLLLQEYSAQPAPHAFWSGHVDLGGTPVLMTYYTDGPVRLDIPARVALVTALGGLGATESLDLLFTVARHEQVTSIRAIALHLLRQVGEGRPDVAEALRAIAPVGPSQPVPLPPASAPVRQASAPQDPPGGPQTPTLPDQPSWRFYSTAEGGYELAIPFHSVVAATDMAFLRAVHTEAEGLLARFDTSPGAYGMELLLQVPRPADGSIDYDGLNAWLVRALTDMVPAIDAPQRFARYTTVAEDADQPELRCILTPRHHATEPMRERCPLPSTPAEFDAVLHRWFTMAGGLVDSATVTITGTPGDRRLVMTAADGVSVEEWVAMWQDLADAFRSAPCRPRLHGRLTVAMTLPQWPAGAGYAVAVRAAVETAFADSGIALTLEPFRIDPQRWMPGRAVAYPIGNNLVVVPQASLLGAGMPFGTQLADRLEECYRRLEGSGIRLAEHALLIFFEAPAVLHDEDPPRDFNAAMQATVAQGVELFGTTQASLLATMGRPQGIHVLTVQSPDQAWRIYFALAPRRLIATTAPARPATPLATRLRQWYEAIRPYWPAP